MPTPTPSSRLVEPGAIAGAVPNTALPAQPVQGPAAWGALPGSIAPNFTAVQPLLLPAGTVLRRVFGYPDAADPWPSWETGSWWTRQPLPATEGEWRAQFAVEAQWNGGQCVVAWTTPQDIHAWAGPATPQAGEYADGEPAPGYYLPGGGEQIYIAPAALPIGTWSPGSTPWFTPPPSAPAASTATKSAAPQVAPAPSTATAATLGAAVEKLGALLQAMSREAATRGVNGGALRFQALQLQRINTRLAAYSSGTSASAAHFQAILRGLAGLARHVHTAYVWSVNATAASAALHDVVTQAATLLSSGVTAPTPPVAKPPPAKKNPRKR